MWPLGTLMSLQGGVAGKGFSSPYIHFIVKQASQLSADKEKECNDSEISNGVCSKYPQWKPGGKPDERNTNVVPVCPNSGDGRHHRQEAGLFYGLVRCPFFLLSHLEIDAGKVKSQVGHAVDFCRDDIPQPQHNSTGAEDDKEGGWEAVGAEGGAI